MFAASSSGNRSFSIFDEDEDMDMVSDDRGLDTDINDREIDEEMGESLSSVMDMHLKKFFHYKRSLEKAQASTTAGRCEGIEGEGQGVGKNWWQVRSGWEAVELLPWNGCQCRPDTFVVEGREKGIRLDTEMTKMTKMTG